MFSSTFGYRGRQFIMAVYPQSAPVTTVFTMKEGQELLSKCRLRPNQALWRKHQFSYLFEWGYSEWD